MRSATLTRIERRLDVVLLVTALAVVPVIIIEQSHAIDTAKTADDATNLLGYADLHGAWPEWVARC